MTLEELKIEFSDMFRQYYLPGKRLRTNLQHLERYNRSLEPKEDRTPLIHLI